VAPDDEKDNGWDEYQKFVVNELSRHSRELDCVHKKTTRIIQDVASLKTEMKLKGGIFGLIGGLIPAAVVAVYFIIKIFM